MLALLNQNTPLPSEFNSLPGTKLLVKKGIQRDPSLSVASYREAIEASAKGQCLDTEVLKLQSTIAKRDPLTQLLSRLSTNTTSISTAIANRVGANIPTLSKPLTSPIRIVLGGRSDGYVEELDGKMEMAVDLRTILQSDLESTEKQLWALIDHEVWHIAFLEYVKENWNIKNPSSVNDPAFQLIFTILNEGYGHYLSILAYAKWDEDKALSLLDRFDTSGQEPGFSALFSARIEEFVQATDSRKWELVQDSHEGDRMAGKWGALMGARMVAELRRKKGLTYTVTLLESNPFSLIEAHSSIARSKVTQVKSFQKIMNQAKLAAIK